MQPKKQEQDQTQRGNYFSLLMASDMMSYQHAMQIIPEPSKIYFFSFADEIQRCSAWMGFSENVSQPAQAALQGQWFWRY